MRALDLGCGAGGMSRNLIEAGFHVVGVDFFDHPDRPEPVEFVQADWHEIEPGSLGRFDVAFGSSPCQGFSTARPDKVNRPNAEDFGHMERVVAHLQAASDLWVFENVAGSVNFLSPLLGRPFLKTRGHYFWGTCPPFLLKQTNLPSKGWTKDKSGKGTQRPKGKDSRQRAMIPPEIGVPMAEAMRDSLLTGWQTKGQVKP